MEVGQGLDRWVAGGGTEEATQTQAGPSPAPLASNAAWGYALPGARWTESPAPDHFWLP